MLNHQNIPGAGSISETMEFMRKMWEGMAAPAMGIPSLSVDEINKKIADLKTVASWLELNMNMLRATIQTLEVQSATLSTLQAMGAMGGMMTQRDDVSTAGSAAAASSAGFTGWPSQPVPQPAQQSSSPASTSCAADTGHPEKAASADEAAPVVGSESQPFSFPQADFQAPLNSPNAWWNLLQNQFRQAVGNVLADEAPARKMPSMTKKKATKAAAGAKPRTRAKSPVVQSRQSKPASRKQKSP